MAAAHDRMVYIDKAGATECVKARPAAVLPENFAELAYAFQTDLSLAIDCLAIWGTVPLPVLKSIHKSSQPFNDAIEEAMVKNRTARKGGN